MLATSAVIAQSVKNKMSKLLLNGGRLSRYSTSFHTPASRQPTAATSNATTLNEAARNSASSFFDSSTIFLEYLTLITTKTTESISKIRCHTVAGSVKPARVKSSGA